VWVYNGGEGGENPPGPRHEVEARERIGFPWLVLTKLFEKRGEGHASSTQGSYSSRALWGGETVIKGVAARGKREKEKNLMGRAREQGGAIPLHEWKRLARRRKKKKWRKRQWEH